MKKFILLSLVLFASCLAFGQAADRSFDPCNQLKKVDVNSIPRINQLINTAASVQLITGVPGKRIYFCFAIVGSLVALTNYVIVEGTGSTCATGTAGLMTGGTTAATGFTAEASPKPWGTGGYEIGFTATAGTNVCILLSAANQVSGSITYAFSQ